MIKKRYLIIILICTFIDGCTSSKNQNSPIINTIQVGNTFISLTQEATGLYVPWDLQYDSINNAIIFSEIDGSIRRLDIESKKITLIDSLSDVYHTRTLGLLGMSLYQPPKKQAYLYLSYTSKRDTSIYSNLYRYNYSKEGFLSNPKLLLQIPGNTGHNGSRIIVSTDHKLYWATGDAAISKYAQDSTVMNGKILRLDLDGSIPKDNPIPNSYVYAWGFRNMQGLTYSPQGTIYASEHGDAIEDEINLIQPLKNYGWPEIEGRIDTEAEGAIADLSPREEPMRSWTPVIAPSGMAYYGSETIPELKNSLLLATLKSQSLRILSLSEDGMKIVDEQILFTDQLGRLRAVLVLPNGDIYFCSSNRDWNPQSGFPKPHDDVIYRLRKTNKPIGKIIKPEQAKQEITSVKTGQQLYEAYCASCHKTDGQGLGNTFPPLAHSKLVNGDKNSLLKLLLNGIEQSEISKYEGAMPSFNFLSDHEIISIGNYIRSSFGNNAQKIKTNNLKHLR